MDISQYTPTGARTPEHTRNTAAPRTQSAAAASGPIQQTQQTSATASEDGLFDTLLDTVNPLQHIPGVSSLYQAATGDSAGPLASMAGGFLFGGPIGLAAGAAGSFLEMLTGKSLMEHAVALFSGDGEDTAPTSETVLAATDSGPTDPMLGQLTTEGLSLQQYQSFAAAEGTVRPGFGAAHQEVALASNVWTQRALKDATGLYQSQQNLGTTTGGATNGVHSGQARETRLI